MYERILESRWDANGEPVEWTVYSADFHDVLSKHSSIESAKAAINAEIHQARVCPSCED